MKKAITLFAALFVTVSIYAQGGLKIIPAQKYSNPSSVQLHPCIADTMYFSIGTQSGGNFATGDIVQLDIFLPQGISFGGYYNAAPGQTVIAGPNSFNVSNLGGVSSFLFKYTIIPGCNYFSSGTTTGLRDSIVAYLNNAWASTDTLAYTVTSPYIVFSSAGSVNIQYDQGEFNQTFQRRMTFVNTTSVPFNGEAEFADDTWLDILNTAVEFIHDTAYIIGAGTVGITGNTLTPIQARINMLINGLQNGDTLVVEETLKLKACPNPQIDNTNTEFTLNYGCVGNMCKNTGPLNTEVNLDMSYQPDLDYKLVDPSYAVCIGNEVNRIVRIINTGGGATDTVRIQYLGSRKKPSYIDTTTYKIYQKDNLGNPVYMTFDDRFGNPSYNIVRELVYDVPLQPGDSMFFSYTEVFDCIDTADYVSYFNNVLNVNDYYIKICLEKRCYNTVCKDADNNYHGWDTWKHSYSLGQVFNNMNGMMSDNDVAWFDIPNQSMLHPGDNTNKRMGCNPDSSVIEVELNLGAGLGLVYGAIDSIELRSNHNGAYDYIYPFEVVYVCGTGSIRATGDKAYARFRIPPAFFTDLAPTDFYNNGDKAQLNSLFDDFFGNFSVRFKLRADCDYAAQHGGKAEVKERVFFVYNMPCDSSCKIPLAEVKDFVQVNCPGCELPGWNLKTFNVERRNIDYPDTNNNHYPDVYPLTGTAAGADRSEVMQGDTIDCSLMGFATSGAMTFGDMGFPYKFARLELTGPVVKHFAFLKASGRYKSNGAVMPFIVPTASGRFTPNGFYIDLSIDTLKLKYGLTPALLDSFNVNDTIWIDTLAFRVNDNLTNGSGANPYFSLETIDAILHMSGTAYDGMIKTDALVVYEDPSTWNSLTLQDKKNLTYWCTGATGKIIGIGYSFNHAAYIKNFSQSPMFPGNCYKQIMFKSFGDAGTQGNYSNILQEYIDGNTGTWNAFSYELRNLWMADSIRFEFPGEFSPIRVELQPTSLMYDASINQIRYNFDPVYSADCMYNVPLAQTRIAGNTITIYPDSMMTQDTQGPARPCDSSLSGWGETKRYRAYLTLTMNDYHLTPDIIATPPGTFPVVSYWYNYPGTITGDTSIVDTLKGYPWTQYFDKPSIVLKTQTVPHLPVANDFTWNVNINSTDSITQDKVNNWTDSSFVYLKSPTNSITVTAVQWQSGGTIPVKSIFDSGNLYALGAVGVEVGGPLSGMNISKNIKVDAHFNCANGNKDSLMLITGWNCYHYPSDLTSLAGACFLDTTWLVVQVEDCDIQMQILNPPDTVSVCDTVKYKILLDASGIGNINNTQLHILTPAGNELSYIAGSTTVYYLQDSLNYNSQLEPVDSSATSGVYGWYTWVLDNIPFVQNHFSAGGSDLIVEFSLLTGCSFETNGVNIAVTAINYCGKIIGPTVINHHPLFVTDKPVADSLTVTVVSDTLKLCDSSVNADLLIQNNGTIPTNGTNIISLTLPPNLTIAGGTTPDSSSGNMVYWTAGMLAAGGTESIHVVFNTTGCPPYTYGLQLQSLKTLMCNGDTCDYTFTIYNHANEVIPVETPDASFTLLNDTICLGAAITLNGVDSCINHIWNFGDGNTASTQNASNTYNTAGTFVITHTEFNNCDTVVFNDTIIVVPINVVASNDTIICAGDSVTLTASGATTYSWSNGATGSSTTVNPTITTTYTVTGTTTAGCMDIDTVVVIVNPLPVVFAGNDTTICTGNSVVLTANGATTYNWSNGANTASTTVTPVITTTYTVTGTSNGCFATDAVVVNVISNPAVIAGLNQTICSGQTATLNASGATSYTWSNGATTGSTVVSPIITTTYTVTGISNGCFGIDSVVIIVNPNPVVIASGDTTVCAGTSVTLTASGATTYEWSNGVSTSSTTVNPTVTTTYTVTGTLNGCDGTDEVVVTINNSGFPNFSITTDSCMKAGDTVHFGSTATGATTWYWDFGDGSISNAQNPTHVFVDNGYFCVTLIAGNNCGSDTVTTTIFLNPNCFNCLASYTITDGTMYTGIHTWNSLTPITVEGDVFLQAGCTLTISNTTVLFAPKGRIVVDTNAVLNVLLSNLTSIDTCAMWQGIEVWGKTSQPSTSTIQGKAIIEGSSISNAHIAVLLGKRNPAGCTRTASAFNYRYSGGVIRVIRSSLLNDGIGIKFTRKQNSEGTRNRIQSLTTQCFRPISDAHYNSLTSSNPYPNAQNPWAGAANETQRTNKGIVIDAIKNFEIANCNFFNLDTCIKSLDSKFNVYCTTLSSSTFNFDTTKVAIYIANTVSSIDNRHNIYNNSFNKTKFEGIVINGGMYDLISNNAFGNHNILVPISQSRNGVSISLTGASGYNVIDNNIYGYQIGVNAINSANGGGYVGALNNTSGNTFDHCNLDVNTKGNNSILKLKCNTCDNGNYTAGVYSGRHWFNKGTLANQGQNVPPPYVYPNPAPDKLPAGNEFGPYFQNLPNMTRQQIQSVNGSYIYYHHNPSNNPLVKPLGQPSWQVGAHTNQTWPVKTLTSCIPVLNPNPNKIGSINVQPFTKLDSLQHKIDSLQLKANLIEAALDGGQTLQLLLDIDRLAEGLLKNKLIAKSPLSDEVIIKMIETNRLSNGNYKNVMLINLPVSRDVEPWFWAKQQTLPTGIAEQLGKLQGWNDSYTSLTQMERQVENVTAERLLLLNQLIIALTDTNQYNRRADAITLLERETTDHAKMILAASYYEDGDVSAVNTKLNALNQTTQDNIDFVTYYNLLLGMYQTQRTIYDITTSEANVARDIAQHCPPSIATENARALLYAVFGEQYEECPIDDNAKTIENTTTEENTDDISIGENYPDPFSDVTNIPYNMQEGSKGTLIIKATDGRLMAIFQLPDGKGVFELNTQNWAAGIYYYGIEQDGQMTEYKKMVLIK